MKIDSKTIAGLPIKTARDLMRELNVSRIDAETVLHFLNTEHWRSTVDAACKANPRIPKSLRSRVDFADHKQYCKIWHFKFQPIKAAEAERVFAALLAEGYLEPNEPECAGDKRKYQTSRKGRQLAAANLTKRFGRDKADNEVAALIARANEINARDELVFYVKRITAFGSYLTEIKDLGDIDLVVEVAARREKNTDESKYRARNSGKTVDFMASLGYGEREVLQLLKARKSRLSFA
jgi:predicted nucleotidyltransferase